MIRKNLVVENARIAFRNFSGAETKFNRAGKKNFCVIFDNETGEDLKEQGWNVRPLKPRDEDELPDYCLEVAAEYGKIPPSIYMITGRKKTQLDESMIRCLDHAEIINCDIVIRPYNWDDNGKTGVKAYVQTMYVEIQEDRFSSKYDFDDDFEGDNRPF